MNLNQAIKNELDFICPRFWVNTSAWGYIDLDELAQSYGVELVQAPFLDCGKHLNGIIQKIKICSSIYYRIAINADYSVTRQRLALARALGHLISDKFRSYSLYAFEEQKNYIQDDGSVQYGELSLPDGALRLSKIEANVIAAELLLPSQIVQQVVVYQQRTPELKESVIADSLGVSVELLNMRKRELGL